MNSLSIERHPPLIHERASQSETGVLGVDFADHIIRGDFHGYRRHISTDGPTGYEVGHRSQAQNREDAEQHIDATNVRNKTTTDTCCMCVVLESVCYYYVYILLLYNVMVQVLWLVIDEIPACDSILIIPIGCNCIFILKSFTVEHVTELITRLKINLTLSVCFLRHHEV